MSDIVSVGTDASFECAYHVENFVDSAHDPYSVACFNTDYTSGDENNSSRAFEVPRGLLNVCSS